MRHGVINARGEDGCRVLPGRAVSDPRPRTLIVGLGKTGLSVARLLASQGVVFAAADSRAAPPGLAAYQRDHPAAEIHLGPFDPTLFSRMSTVVLSPGVTDREPAVQAARAAGAEVLGDIELFARLARAPVAAITGSNGKSTVTTLLGEMARNAGLCTGVGGNLGIPVLELLDDDTELYVLELSSFQLETTDSLDVRVGSVLNLSADHLDRYADLTDYVAAKRRIFRGNGAMVLNADDPLVTGMAEPGREVIRFTLNPPAAGEFGLLDRDGESWLARGAEPWLAVRELRIGGLHNQANALAALAMGTALGLSRSAMLATLREFRGLAHRCELIAEHAGIRWYNDSKGTNVGATVAAVRGLPGPVVLIAGGEGKGQDFAPLAQALRGKVRALVLIGRDAALIGAAVGDTVPQYRAADMDEAVGRAAQLAEPGDNVLLSPACASFDMFANFEARGRAFVAAVQELGPC